MNQSRSILYSFVLLGFFFVTFTSLAQTTKEVNDRLDYIESRLINLNDSLKEVYQYVKAAQLDTIYKKSGAAAHVNYNGAEKDFGHQPKTPAQDDKGWINVNNMQSEIRISGFVQTAIVYDWEQAYQQQEFSSSIAQIPRNPGGAAWFMDANSSRFFIESRSLAKNGTVIKSYIGMDMRGDPTGGFLPRVRQIYASINNFTIGFAAGSLSGYWPAYLDAGAPGAYPLFRDALLRYSIPLGNTVDKKILSFSLEKPTSEIDNGTSLVGFPSFTTRFDLNANDMSKQFFAAIQLRQIKGSDSLGTESGIQSRLGYTATLAGNLDFGTKKQHSFKFQGIAGTGVSTWDTSVSGAALDGYYDNTINELNLINKWGLWASLEVAWMQNRRLTSTFMYALTNVDNFVAQSASTYNKGTTYMAGLYYLPWIREKVIIALEYFYGERQNFKPNENGDQLGTRNRINVVFRYTFGK